MMWFIMPIATLIRLMILPNGSPKINIRHTVVWERNWPIQLRNLGNSIEIRSLPLNLVRLAGAV